MPEPATLEYVPTVEALWIDPDAQRREEIERAFVAQNILGYAVPDADAAKRILEACTVQVVVAEDFDGKGVTIVTPSGRDPAAIARQVDTLRTERLHARERLEGVEYFYEDPANIYVFGLYMDVRTGLLGESPEEHVPPMGCTCKDGMFTVWIHTRGEQAVSRRIFRKYIEEDYAKRIEKASYEKAEALLSSVRRIREKDLGKLSDEELAGMVREVIRRFDAKARYASLSSVMEFTTNAYTDHLKSVLAKRITGKEELEKVFTRLTTPTKMTYLRRFEQELARLALRRLAGEDTGQELARILKQWTWVTFNYDGEPITEEWVRTRIEEMGTTKEDFERCLVDDAKSIRKEQEALSEKYALTPEERELFRVAKEILYLKIFRKGVYAETFHANKLLLGEIGRRVGCTASELLHLTIEEALAVLAVGRPLQGLVAARQRESMFLHADGKTYALSNELQGLCKGKAPAADEGLKGVTAFPGVVRGRVKHVNTIEDMQGFEKGMILVSRNTNPSLVPAMQKAAAFVTDTGGLTCHAACVAREMQTPCIVGTGRASKVLKEGELIEVDATNGVVTVLGKA